MNRRVDALPDKWSPVAPGAHPGGAIRLAPSASESQLMGKEIGFVMLLVNGMSCRPSSGQRQNRFIPPDGALALVPAGQLVDLLLRKRRKDQMRELRLPSQRFGFVECQPEYTRMTLEQQVELPLEPGAHGRQRVPNRQ